MKKIVLAMTMIVMCGLLGAMGLTSAGSTAPEASAAMAPASTAPASIAEEPTCDDVVLAEDAASCFAGGWEAQLTCCFASGRALERFRHPATGRTKCCGACFQ
jgi:hypothetical protein